MCAFISRPYLIASGNTAWSHPNSWESANNGIQYTMLIGVVCVGQRLRDAKSNAKHAPSCAETPRIDEAQHNNESHVTVSSAGPFHLIPRDNSTSTSWVSKNYISATEEFLNQSRMGLPPFNIGNISVCANLTTPIPSPTTSPPAPITVLGALYINGKILGLSCSCSIPGRSLPVSDDIPLPLHPTDLQLTTIHARWIDRVPFPKMRDNLITVFGMLDDEEIIADLFTMPSFSITPGLACWDPRAWKIEKPFADKWGYLLF
jgi:hypothetical protein